MLKVKKVQNTKVK